MAIPAAFKKCVAEIKKAAPDVINDEQAVELLKRLNDRFVEKKAQAGANAEKFILDEANKMANENALAVQIEKRNAAINMAVRKRVDKFLAGYSDPAEGLVAYMGGINKVRAGARLSVDAQGKGLTMGYLGKMVNSMDKDGLWEVFASGTLDKQIAQELWEIGREGGNPGVSKSAEAQKIAGVIHGMQADLVNRQNNAGAFIKLMPGYIVRQGHDMTKIRRAGYEAWKERVMPLLDHEATFGSNDPELVLRGAYEGLASGIHIRAAGIEGDAGNARLFGFHGPANLAKKISQNRLLHFKDADSWTTYNGEFGVKSLRDAVLSGVEHGSRNVAMLENFGTNPAAFFDRIVSDLVKGNRDNSKLVDKLRGSYIENLFKTLDGTTRIPVDVNSARWSNNLRMLQTMSKLGGAVISSISDIPAIAAELRYQGRGILESYLEPLGSLFRGRGNAEQKEIARLLGVGLDGMLGEVHGRFNSMDGLPGKASRMTQLFFKWNGLNWWTDSLRTGTALVMSNNLAEQAGKALKNLDVDTQRIFGLYNITDREWNLFRKTAFKNEDGNMYLTPDKLDKVDRAEIESILTENKINVTEKNIQRELDRIKSAFQTYFIDRADYAVPTPGAREKAYLEMGTRPGTAVGEAVRFIAQFKSFPLSVMMRGVQREVYGKGADSIMGALKSGNGEMASLAHLMVATTIAGYVSMLTKDILKGRTPRDAREPKVILAAFSQGGGFGIYGDFLFGEFSRYGRSALATAAGPVLGQVDDVAELYTRLRNGDDAAAQAARIAINNTPYINLFYTRTALDYLFLYQLQEAMNPGYLNRMEARVRSENGQEFLFPPSRQ
jgi:hypothetical protein